MSKIKLTGDSSGYVEISAPNAAGNNTLELPASGSKIVVSDGSDNINVAGIATIGNGLNVTGGNVGIGTENPQRVAHIFGSASSGTNLLVETPSTNNDSAGIKLIPSSGNEYEIQSVVSTAGVNPNSFIVYDRTNDAYRMIIDSSGRVTMPYQPCFHATGTSSGSSFTSDTKLPFDTEYFDVGSHYDHVTNYRFTAPIAGKYFFYASYLTYPSSDPSYVTLSFHLNGTKSYEYGFSRGANSAQEDRNMSSILSLSANDYVEVYVEPNSGTSYYFLSGGHAHFFGYLIG